MSIPRMRGFQFAIGVALVTIAVSMADAQGETAQSAASNGVFTPLEQWKTAVISGDSAGLRAFYSSNPRADITVGRKKLTPDEDAAFWIGLKARSIKVEVLRDESLRQDVHALEFHAEIESGPSPSQVVYVREGQIWLQGSGQWLLAGVQRTDAAHLEQPANKNKNIYPADADAKAEIKEAEENAAREHKRVLLVFGANWCYDCHVLDLAFHRPDFAATMSRYEVVHVDVGEDGKKNGDLAKQFQVPLSKGIPALAVLEGDGKLLVSQKNGEFENARAMTPQALLEFLNKWKPQAQ